ncbi:MAG: beta-ketoacyl-[acyl-carrier-protein] synthase II [Proteobacteria bacterium]|nr:beta-ketoacyl-[acyl-carrier-protein] synthase II [Pseudomonadota bacterium]
MPRLIASTLASAHGLGLDALAAALAANQSALQPNDSPDWPLATAVGRVAELEHQPWPADWQAWDSRATRLAWLGLQGDGFADAVLRARQRHGAARVGLVIGSSASTIGASESAYRQLAADGGFASAQRQPRLHTPHALADFVQQALGLQGPALTVSTACSSGAKALAVGERWLRLQLADAVVVGGIDALSGSLLYGFNALGLLDPQPCRPFDAARRGISIGEAAAYTLLVRDDEAAAGPDEDAVQLLGYGERSDAHHMSSPHPQGLGAEQALDAALARAGLDSAAAIDFVSLHGTGTAANDEVEAALLARRYAGSVHASATKGLSGHTMGAAGLLQALVCVLALQRGLLAGSGPTAAPDPAFGAAFAERWKARPAQRRIRRAASHAFGFGGNNCVLVFGC